MPVAIQPWTVGVLIGWRGPKAEIGGLRVGSAEGPTSSPSSRPLATDSTDWGKLGSPVAGGQNRSLTVDDRDNPRKKGHSASVMARQERDGDPTQPAPTAKTPERALSKTPGFRGDPGTGRTGR
jgi:hypothetical protein